MIEREQIEMDVVLMAGIGTRPQNSHEFPASLAPHLPQEFAGIAGAIPVR